MDDFKRHTWNVVMYTYLMFCDIVMLREFVVLRSVGDVVNTLSVDSVHFKFDCL